MKSRFVVLASTVVVPLVLSFNTAVSQVHMDIGVRIGPPPPRYECVEEAPYNHAVWVRGHWAWDDGCDRYAWRPGYWVPRRPAYDWVEGSWRRSPRGWSYREGYWQHKGNGWVDRSWKGGNRDEIEYRGEGHYKVKPEKGRGHGRWRD